MATRWFDGETDMGFRSAWSHLWDQCFASVDQYEVAPTGLRAPRPRCTGNLGVGPVGRRSYTTLAPGLSRSKPELARTRRSSVVASLVD